MLTSMPIRIEGVVERRVREARWKLKWRSDARRRQRGAESASAENRCKASSGGRARAFRSVVCSFRACSALASIYCRYGVVDGFVVVRIAIRRVRSLYDRRGIHFMSRGDFISVWVDSRSE